MSSCRRCGAARVVDNIDYKRWACGSTRERFYDGHRTDIDLNYVCEERHELENVDQETYSID